MYVSFFSRFIFGLLYNGTPQMSLGNNLIEILSKNLLKVSDLKKINLNVKNAPINRLPCPLFSELRVSNLYQGCKCPSPASCPSKLTKDMGDHEQRQQNQYDPFYDVLNYR